MSTHDGRVDITPRATRFFFVAMACALAHAAVSAYWALGGGWGLDGVGQWAVQFRSQSPMLTAAALLVTALVKLAAGVVPYLASVGRLAGRRTWRALSWAGAGLLVTYGGLNTGVGGAALAGVIEGPADPARRDALRMHVLLWDPAFLVWGIALAAALWLSRRPIVDPTGPASAPRSRLAS